MRKETTASEGRSVWSAALAGAGFMAVLDGIIFHQALDWRHLYDRSTQKAALLSDGILQAASLTAMIAGFFRFFQVKKIGRKAWSAFFYGLAAFQLFDGLFNHKLFRLHPARHVKNTLVYDLAWNGFGLALALTGFLLGKRPERAAAHPHKRKIKLNGVSLMQ